MTITATEFKAKCLALIDQVQKTGHPIVISKHGKEVVRLVPEYPTLPWKALARRGELKGNPFAPVIHDSDIEALR